MTCPVCGSHTSGVFAAVLEDRPCPVCGAPAEIIARVSELRRERADEDLKSELSEALANLGRVTAERDRLRLMIADIRDVFTRDEADADRQNLEQWRSQ